MHEFVEVGPGATPPAGIARRIVPGCLFENVSTPGDLGVPVEVER